MTLSSERVPPKCGRQELGSALLGSTGQPKHIICYNCSPPTGTWSVLRQSVFGQIGNNVLFTT